MRWGREAPRSSLRSAGARDASEVTVIRAEERYVSVRDGITTRHSFSYGDHYDPGNVAFGPLRAVNEERLEPGAGYDAHAHADVEIVTWVLDGALAHADSTGVDGVVRPGEVQHVSARGGIEHTERNASVSEPLRFLQMMLAPSPDELAAPDPGPPVYRQSDLAGARGYVIDVLRVRPGVTLAAALIDPHDEVTLAGSPGMLHLQVSRGTIALEVPGRRRPYALDVGDAVRAVSPGPMSVRASTAAEVLIWRFDEEVA